MIILKLNFVMVQILLHSTMILGVALDKSVPNSKLPTGDAVVDRFIEVTGGKPAYDKIKNRVRHDRIVHVGMGFEDKAVIYTARPNKRYIHITSEVMGDVENGSDGNVVWYRPPGAAPIVETGEARLAQLSELAFDRLDNWRTYYEKTKLVQETTIDGRSCFEVLMTPKVGRAETHYYDKESGLLVKVRKTLLSSFMPTIIFDISLSDYRAVDGVRLPHKIHQKFEQCGSPRERVFIAERIEQNVDLPADRFTPPKSVTDDATVESMGGLVKQSVGGEERQSAPCRRKDVDKKRTRAAKKGESQSKSPCGGS